MATTPPYDGPEETLILSGNSAENPFLPSPPCTQGAADGAPDGSIILTLSADDTPLHRGLTAPLFSRQTSSATTESSPNPSSSTTINNSNNTTTNTTTNSTTNANTSRQATDVTSVHSADSNTSSQDRALGAHRMLNRLEIIEQV